MKITYVYKISTIIGALTCISPLIFALPTTQEKLPTSAAPASTQPVPTQPTTKPAPVSLPEIPKVPQSKVPQPKVPAPAKKAQKPENKDTKKKPLDSPDKDTSDSDETISLEQQLAMPISTRSLSMIINAIQASEIPFTETLTLLDKNIITSNDLKRSDKIQLILALTDIYPQNSSDFFSRLQDTQFNDYFKPTTDDSMPVVYIAARSNLTQVISRLLEWEATKKPTQTTSTTQLSSIPKILTMSYQYAITHGDAQTLTILLNNSKKYWPTDQNQLSSQLIWNIINLRKKTAQTEETITVNTGLLNVIKTIFKDSNLNDIRKNTTPLIQAIHDNNLAMTKALIQAGADICFDITTVVKDIGSADASATQAITSDTVTQEIKNFINSKVTQKTCSSAQKAAR